MLISRSMNSYMRALRSVTLQPIGWPSRTLKVAIDLRALVITGFWPAISDRSAAAASTFLRSLTPSPMPMLMTIFWITGTCMRFWYLNCSASFLLTTWSNSVRSRGVTRSSGARAFFSAGAPFLSAGAPFLSAGAPFWPPLSPPLACCACLPFSGLSPFSARGALSAFSAFGGFLSVSAIDLDSRALGNADFASRVTLAHKLEPDARRLAVLGIGQRQIGHVDGSLFRDDPALLGAGLLLVPLDDIDAAHQRAIVIGMHLDHLAGATPVAADEHDHLVALSDLGRHHSTSGARDMIFMWFLARSSRGTGPKMRVPTGSICGLISTAALRSKRMIEPSARLMSFEMRTTTAFITSPFLTRPRGIASFTETTITSPIVA